MLQAKATLKFLLMLFYGFVSAIFTPSILNIAFNYSHGIANNPDGTLMMPFGIALVLAIIITDAVFLIKTVRSYAMSVTKKTFTVILFIAVKVVGMWLDQNGRRNFIECFLWSLKN